MSADACPTPYELEAADDGAMVVAFHRQLLHGGIPSRLAGQLTRQWFFTKFPGPLCDGCGGPIREPVSFDEEAEENEPVEEGDE